MAETSFRSKFDRTTLRRTDESSSSNESERNGRIFKTNQKIKMSNVRIFKTNCFIEISFLLFVMFKLLILIVLLYNDFDFYDSYY